MDLIRSKKPSGTYYLVRLIRPHRFKKNEEPKPAGWEGVVDENVANYLSSQMIGAVLFRQPESRRIWVPT